MHTELFCSQVEAAQTAYPKAASILMDDLAQSIKGEKVFIWDNQGSLSVTGQKRLTSEMLAHMKDTFGWTWDDIRNTLQNFIDMGDSTKGFPLVKNTIRNRRMEVYLHEMLTEGYTTIDGMKIAPWNDYAEMIAEYQGSQGAGLNARIDADAIPFEEYAFVGEFDGDAVKYSVRDGKITAESTEAERYAILKDATVKLAQASSERLGKVDTDFRGMRVAETTKAIKTIAATLGINKLNLHNSRLDADFGFSMNSISSSASHQKEYGGGYSDFVKALSCIEQLVCLAWELLCK